MVSEGGFQLQEFYFCPPVQEREDGCTLCVCTSSSRIHMCVHTCVEMCVYLEPPGGQAAYLALKERRGCRVTALELREGVPPPTDGEGPACGEV